MARYILEDQNLDGDFLLGIKALGYRNNNAFSHPPISSSNRHDQPQCGQFIYASTAWSCGRLCGSTRSRAPETMLIKSIFEENHEKLYPS